VKGKKRFTKRIKTNNPTEKDNPQNTNQGAPFHPPNESSKK